MESIANSLGLSDVLRYLESLGSVLKGELVGGFFKFCWWCNMIVRWFPQPAIVITVLQEYVCKVLCVWIRLGINNKLAISVVSFYTVLQPNMRHLYKYAYKYNMPFSHGLTITLRMYAYMCIVVVRLCENGMRCMVECHFLTVWQVCCGPIHPRYFIIT